MRRRYRRTTDLRPYLAVGLLLAIVILVGMMASSFLAVAAGILFLIGDVLIYGWLVAGWRLRPEPPARLPGRPANPKPAATPKPKAVPAKPTPPLIGLQIGTAQSPPRPQKPNLQAAAYNLQSDPRLARLQRMTGIEFERFIGSSVFIKRGYSVGYTPVTGDGGIDLIVRKAGELAAVQCKCYSGTVGAEEVYAFNGALSKGGYQRGYFITTGKFSGQTREWVRDTNIVLIDGARLLEWLDYLEGTERE